MFLLLLVCYFDLLANVQKPKIFTLGQVRVECWVFQIATAHDCKSTRICRSTLLGQKIYSRGLILFTSSH